MRLLLFLFASVGLAQNIITVIPKQDDSDTGELRFREKRANGQHEAIFKAPAALAGTVTWSLPNADASGCWQSNGSGVLSISTCPTGLPVVDTTGLAKGSSDATKVLRVEVDGFTSGATRVSTFPNADITVAGQNFDNVFSGTQTFTSATTVLGNTAVSPSYTFRIVDGGAVGYVLTSDANGFGTWQAAPGAGLPVVDTTGIAKGSADATKIARLEVDGLTTATTRVLTVPDSNLIIAGANIDNQFSTVQTIVSGSDFASLGDDKIALYNGAFVPKVELIGGAGDGQIVVSDSSGTTINALNGYVQGTSYRVGATTIVDASRNADFVTVKLTSGATNGYYLKSDASGNGTWAAVPGGLSTINSETGPGITLAASTGLSVATTTNTVTYTNTGVTAIAGTGPISLSGSTGSVTVSCSTCVDTADTSITLSSGSEIIELSTDTIALYYGAFSPRIFMTGGSGDGVIQVSNSSATLVDTIDVNGFNTTAAYKTNGTTIVDSSRNATFVTTTTTDIYVGSMTGSGNRYVCVASDGFVFDSGSPCV